MIVSEVPGTTRDSIDTVLRRDDSTFVLVDTAGLRRKRKQRQGIEYYSELRALEAAERADVALVLVDASQGVVEQDLAVADVARKAQCGDDRRALEVGRHRDPARGRAPATPSAAAPAPAAHRRVRAHGPRPRAPPRDDRERVRTLRGPDPDRQLNRALQELREARQPPGRRGRRLNLLYGTQVSSRPPRFRFFVNDRSLVTRDYGYWVENELRARFSLEGVPVSIDFVTSE